MKCIKKVQHIEELLAINVTCLAFLMTNLLKAGESFNSSNNSLSSGSSRNSSPLIKAADKNLMSIDVNIDGIYPNK